MKDDGLLLSALLYAPDMFPDAGRLTPVPISGYPTSEGLRLLADLAGAGSLRVVVDRTYPFDDIADAFAGYGRQTLGNIVVRIP